VLTDFSATGGLEATPARDARKAVFPHQTRHAMPTNAVRRALLEQVLADAHGAVRAIGSCMVMPDALQQFGVGDRPLEGGRLMYA
jgi:hypothetical protein